MSRLFSHTGLRLFSRTGFAVLAAITLALFMSTLSTAPAEAAKKAKSTKSEGKFIEFNADDSTVTIKIKKAGKRPKNKKLKLKSGKKEVFRVKPDGSVLTRTSVTFDARPFPIRNIKENTSVIIYWIPDEKNADGRYAKKIDLVLSDEELEAQDKERLEAAKKAGQLGADE